MRHFKERADESHVYSIPRTFAAELMTLQDVLTHAKVSNHDDIRDGDDDLVEVKHIGTK